MTVWRKNTGVAPKEHAGVPIMHVRVRLRDGSEPAQPWPVDTGRHPTTRWTLTGHPFDIVDWRLA